MPTFSGDQLQTIASRILQGAGVSAEEAEIVAIELAGANLVGHDSHGVIRLKQYCDYVTDGTIQPGAPIEVITDLPGCAVIDGNYNFGQVIAAKALELASERARERGMYSVWCRHCNHFGRLGAFTHRAALDGFAALLAVNGPAGGGVVPWGGLERRLGTNPISMAAPWNDDAILLDMTTSATAEGKLRVAFQKGESVPEGWVIDSEGNPSTDPGAYYADPQGAIVPLGGAMGHKGYGLSVMLDVFCGILSGAGIARRDLPPGVNGVWLVLIDVNQMMPSADYAGWIEKYAEWIKGCRKAPGVEEILLPGEVETRRQNERKASGVEIPDTTWKQTTDLAEKLGVSLDV